MSFQEDDLKIAIAMFEAFDLPKVPNEKDINDFGEEIITYILGDFLGARVTKRIYACGLRYDLTLVLITGKTYVEAARVLGRYYEKVFLTEQEVTEELFHLSYYIKKIDSVEKPSKEYLDVLKKLLKRIGKEPIECPWGVGPIVLEATKKMEREKEMKKSLEKFSKRCDEIIAEKIEKQKRHYDGLTTPALKVEIKVKFYGMGEGKKRETKPRFITSSPLLNKKLQQGDKELERVLEATFEILEEEDEKSK